MTSTRPIALGQAVIGALLLGCASIGSFPSPVPLLLVIGAAGTANAAFPLMRTFGAALLGGVATASIALAAVPFSTCAAAHPTPVFSCTGDDPSRHLAGTVIAAALCGASLVLARAAAHAETSDLLAAQLADLRQELRVLSGSGSGAQPRRASSRRRAPRAAAAEAEPPSS